MPARLPANVSARTTSDDATNAVPSWVVGICGVAAVASLLFSILLFLNR